MKLRPALRPVPKVAPHVAYGSRAYLRRVCEYYARALREIEDHTRPSEAAWAIARKALTASVADVVRASTPSDGDE